MPSVKTDTHKTSICLFFRFECKIKTKNRKRKFVPFDFGCFTFLLNSIDSVLQTLFDNTEMTIDSQLHSSCLSQPFMQLEFTMSLKRFV